MKEKEMWEITITGNDSQPVCVRAEDMVAYLYDEADTTAAQSFEAHAQDCASCRTELAQFRQVRVSIGEWRQQALGSLATTALATNAPANLEPVRVVPERKPSALAAIREFFSLSPMWMRAATAALGVVFCALIILTIAHYNEQPKTVIVKEFVPVKPTQEELVIIAKEQSKDKNQIEVTAPKDNSSIEAVSAAGPQKNYRAVPKDKRILRQEGTNRPNLASTPKVKISPQESREIEHDLRLASYDEDEDLPRLSDLIDESN